MMNGKTSLTASRLAAYAASVAISLQYSLA